MVTFKLSGWTCAALLIGICLLIFLLIRGCSSTNTTQQENAKLQSDLSTLKTVSDKEAAEHESDNKLFQDSLNVANAQLTLKSNQLVSTSYDLADANKKVTDLLSKYKAIHPNNDTSITTVPNEYISDCADCFGQLAAGQQLVSRYKAENDNISSAFKNKISILENKVVQLNAINDNLKGTVNDAMEIAKAQQNKAEIRRTLYFTLGAIAVNKAYPTGVGGGLMYSDKRKRLFGVNYFVTNIGPVYQAQLSMPLSFKR